MAHIDSPSAAHIACCFDQRMELPFLVLAISLKKRLKGDRNVILHAFHSEPIALDPAYFEGLNSATFELRFRQIENPFHRVVVSPPHMTPACLLRLLLPSVLKDIDRVVYLDCDLIVLRNIVELYDTDLSGLALAGCSDFFLRRGAPAALRLGRGAEKWLADAYLREVVELADHKAYFNSGVLVMDLKKFRDRGLMLKAETFLEKTNAWRVFADQDALNHVINGAFVKLDARWNTHPNQIDIDINSADGEIAALAAQCRSDPWIVHYAGPNKPWSCERRRTRWDELYWHEVAQTPALPLLVRSYLEACDRRGFTQLFPANLLLSRGKPQLSKRDILAHGKKYRSIAAVVQASAAVGQELDSRDDWANGSGTLISVDDMSCSGGAQDGKIIIFDLKAANGHLVFGPYLWFPAGQYEATFDLTMTGVMSGPTSKLVIEVVDETNRYLAQRDVSPVAATSESTLQFVLGDKEMFVEFRVFATGFTEGELRFAGVRLCWQGTLRTGLDWSPISSSFQNLRSAIRRRIKQLQSN